MKTKILSVFLMSILMVSLMGTFVLAQSDDSTSQADQNSVLGNAFALPEDEPITSTGTFGDRVSLFFAKDPEKKTKIKLRIAAKKLKLAEEHENNGKSEEAKEAIEEHEKALDEADESLDEIAVDGDLEQVKKALKITLMQKYKLELMYEKQEVVKEKILERKAETGKMTEEQLAKLNEVFSGINEKRDARLEKLNHRIDSLEARLKVLGMTDAEIEELVSNFETFFNEKSQQRQERVIKFGEKQDEITAKIKAIQTGA